MTTLKDLLERAKLVQDVTSGRALSNIAERHGHRIDRTQVNAILKGTYKSRPSRPLLEAIAFLAMADPEEVYAAADMPMPGPSFAAELPPDVDQLLPHERAAVLGVIRGFLRTAEIREGVTRLELSWMERLGLVQTAMPDYDPGLLGDQREVYVLSSEELAQIPDDALLHDPDRRDELEEWLAARKDPTGKPSAGQRRRRKLQDVGEESQDPGGVGDDT